MITSFPVSPGFLRVRRPGWDNLLSHYVTICRVIMAVTLSGIFVSLSCLLKATLGEEIAGGSCDVNDSFMDIALFKLLV